MKFTSAIVLVASLLAPANVEAANDSNKRHCTNKDKNVAKEGMTQVNISCTGDAADFGRGQPGVKIDCFKEGNRYDCRNPKRAKIQAKIVYKIKNAMKYNDMILDWAEFKFGGEYLSLKGSNGHTPAKETERANSIEVKLEKTQAITYSYTATFDPCDGNDISRMAGMRMKLKPTAADQAGKVFFTNKCGTDDIIKFNLPFGGAADFGPGAGAAADFGPGAGAAAADFGPGLPPNSNADLDPGADAKAPKDSKAPSAPKASKAPHTSKSPTVGKGSKSPTVGKGDGSGEEGQRRNNRVRRATSRRTPVRA